MPEVVRNLAGMNRFFHWCSRGLTADLLFANEQEFIAGMNRIAVCYLYCLEKGHPVRIVAFCLLNNHFHFVLYGTEEDTQIFMEHYSYLTGKWIAKHRGERLHDSIELGHWPAEGTNKVREKVIYTLRQTLEAGLRITPQGYPWCSARLMFYDNSLLLDNTRVASDFSARAASRFIFSETELPKEWRFLHNGMIWPGEYTDVQTAEGMFTGVKDFMFSLNNGNVDKAVLSEMSPEVPSLPDTEIKNKAESLAMGIFGRKGLKYCPADERIKIAGFIRKELHCGYKQLARIVRMNEEDLRKTV
ncbi:MAG: hypothetical protein II891_03340 [Bacteroidales bacterium]|nr:hypothetical protein [Bacteroidales bacterium]